jgi:hypothetical protein
MLLDVVKLLYTTFTGRRPRRPLNYDMASQRYRNLVRIPIFLLQDSIAIKIAYTP